MQHRSVMVRAVALALGCILSICSCNAQIAVCDTASELLPKGCKIVIPNSDIGMEVHYLATGTEPTSEVKFALTGKTAGYLSISFGKDSTMYPSDCVIGWMTSSGSAKINVFDIKSLDITPSDLSTKFVITEKSATEANGITTIYFTRVLETGNYPIDLKSVRFNVAWSERDSLVKHDSFVQIGLTDLLGGGVVKIEKDPRDKFWVIHGALAIIGWAFFVPHAIVFAAFKAKFGVIFDNPAMWFHLHRALQFLGLVAHIVVVLLPTLEFGKYTQDSLLTSHKILAWSLTAFLGHQWISAVFFRPNKDHAKRGLWNMIHFAGGRIAPLAALATIVIGIELYVRKQAPEKIMTKSSWIAFLVAALGSVVLVVIVMLLRPAPPPKEAETDVDFSKQATMDKTMSDPSISIEIEKKSIS